MAFILLILLFNFLTNAVVSGYLGIKIIKNEDGLETPVTALVEIKAGANFSLNCKIVGPKPEALLYNKVVWGKRIGKLKFINKYMFMENNVTDDADLNFTSVTVYDQGDYFCAIPVHKLLKTVSLIVRPGFERKVAVLRERCFVGSYAKGSRGIRKRDSPDSLEFLEENRSDKEELRKLQREEEYRKKEEKTEPNRHTKHIEIGFAVVGALIIIGILLYVVCMRFEAKLRIQQDIQEVENLTTETTEMGNGIRLLHEEVVNTHYRISLRGTEEVYIGNDQMATFVPNLYDNSYSTHGLPVGHLYENELSNSYSLDLPPSYEEAVIGAKLSASPANDSLISATRAPKYEDSSL